MVYKKFIKKGGKKFGPYYYESYRDSKGNVKTRYVSSPDISAGAGSSSFNIYKVISLIAVVLLVALLSFANLGWGGALEKTSNIGKSIFGFANSVYSAITGYGINESNLSEEDSSAEVGIKAEKPSGEVAGEEAAPSEPVAEQSPAEEPKTLIKEEPIIKTLGGGVLQCTGQATSEIIDVYCVNFDTGDPDFCNSAPECAWDYGSGTCLHNSSFVPESCSSFTNEVDCEAYYSGQACGWDSPPNASNFSVGAGTTNFSLIITMQAVPDMTLATDDAKIVWNNAVNASDQDFDSNIILGAGFVSVNPSALNSDINSSANITINGVSCPAIPYYTDGFYSTFADVKANSAACPFCTNVACSGNTLTFTTSHFSGFVEQSTCGELNESNTVYTLQNNLTTTGTCFSITADNVTLDGNGYTVTGDGTGYGINHTRVSNPVYTNLTLRNITISGFSTDVYGKNAVNQEGAVVVIYSSNISSINEVISTGGWGGKVEVFNSSINTIDAYGGNNGPSIGPAGGGTVIVTNSIVSIIRAYGGNGAAFGGSSGGIVALTDSNFSTIDCHGGSGTGSGSGGQITLNGANVYLANSSLNLAYGTGSPSGQAGILVINYTNSFNDSQASYGAQLKLKIINFKYGEIDWTMNTISSSSLGNLSDNVILSNNSAYLNSSAILLLNVSANITLNMAGWSFNNPIILKDGIPCGSACYNFTSLNASTVVFNVSSWSNYSIGEGPITGYCPGGMAGSGNSSDPCQIYNWTQLNATRDNLTLYYQLMTNLTGSDGDYASLGGNWTPIGDDSNPFAGNFNGNNNTISDLIINGLNYMGLFSYSTGNISNLGLININITSSFAGGHAGGLVGVQTSGTISNCYSTGIINADDTGGGLVGVQFGAGGVINNSYSTVNVTGWDVLGGLAGSSNGIISNSYATGTVIGDDLSHGGLVGVIGGGIISNSYATGTVISFGGWAGGFVGRQNGGIINNSYSIGSVSGTLQFGGFVGSYYSGTVANSFWDMNTSGQSSSAGGTGKTTDQMKSISTFTAGGWNINSSLTDLNNGYPYLGWQANNNSYVWFISSTPNITQVTEYNITGTAGGTVIRGQNVTINATVTGAPTNVWVTIWRAAIGGPIVLLQYLSNLFGNLWGTIIQTNYTFPLGIVNYTVYANASTGEEVNLSGNFTVLASDEIAECGWNITQPGTYTLMQDISVNGTCIIISSDDVTLDGNGHTVTGNTSGSGVYAHGVNNATIKNFRDISKFRRGIDFSRTGNSLVKNLTITSSSWIGVSLDFNCPNNTFEGLIIQNGSSFGFYIGSTFGSINNTVKNVIFRDNEDYGIAMGGDYNTLDNITCYGNHAGGLAIGSGSGGSVSEGNLVTNANLTNNNVTNVALFDTAINNNISLTGSGGVSMADVWVAGDGNRIGGNFSSATGIIMNGTGKTLYLLEDSNFAGTGISITADNVTLDLKGFTLTGDNNGSDYGIYASGRKNITLKNGTIQWFGKTTYNGIGIFFISTINSEVSDILSLHNYQGVNLTSSNSNNFRNIVSSDHYDGFHLESSSSNNFTNMTTAGNYYGFYIRSSNSNTFVDVITTDVNAGMYFYASNSNTLSGIKSLGNVNGINMHTCSSNNVSNVMVSGAGNAGVMLQYVSASNFTNITATSNSFVGLQLYGSSSNNLININSSSNNKGINLFSSSSNSFSNITANSNNNYGIYLGLSSDSNVFANITANSNVNYGVSLDSGSLNNFAALNIYNNSLYGLSSISGANNTFVGINAASNNLSDAYISGDNNRIGGNFSSSTGIIMNGTGKTLYLLEDSNFNGTGISITADNVTLDGNGYTVTGNREDIYFGVYGNARKDVIIKNIAIGNFSAGVYFDGTTSNCTLTGNKLDNNVYSGAVFADSGPYNNSIIGNSLSYNGDIGLHLYSSNNKVYNNQIQSNLNYGISAGGSGNILLNNNISNNSNEDLSASGGINYLVYNNSFGEIKWAKSSFSVVGALIFPGNISLTDNNAYFNPAGFTGNLNSSANVSLYGINNNFSWPAVLKDGVYCNSSLCPNYTSLSASDVKFGVPSWSNYSIGEGDLTKPNINFTNPTETSGSTVYRSDIIINVSANDSISGIKNITTYLYNSAFALINSTVSFSSPAYTNFSGLANGKYSFNATACDYGGNCNNTETRSVWVGFNTTNITGCMNITAPGTYTLQEDLGPNLAGTCIEIQADNVTIDGNGHAIDGNGDSGSYIQDANHVRGNSEAIYSTSHSNITIKNFGNISDYPYSAIDMNYLVDGAFIINNTFNSENILGYKSNNVLSLGNTLISGGIGGYRGGNTSAINNIITGYLGTGIGVISGQAINNTISNCYGGISSLSSLVENNTISNITDAGILMPSSGDMVYRNNIFNASRGLYIVNSKLSLSNVSFNNITSSRNYGIYTIDTNNVILSENRIIGNSSYAIYLDANTRNMAFAHNIIGGNRNYSVYVPSSSYSNNISIIESSPANIAGAYVEGNNNRVGGNFSSATGIIMNGTGNRLYMLEDSSFAGSEGTGIEIDAANVTLDGNGFAINGMDAGGIGVFINTTNNATIKNFKNITNFAGGIWAASSSYNRILNNSIFDNIFDFGLGRGIWGTDLWLDASNNNLVQDNQIGSSLYGIYLDGGNNNITRNTIKDNNNNTYSSGIQINSGSGNVIENNNMTNNSFAGVMIYSSANLISNNFITNSTWHGIALATNASNNMISENRLDGNLYSGVYLDRTSNETLLNNQITNSNYSIGVYPYLVPPPTSLNYLIYNNSFGEIKWTNLSFLNNLTLVGDLIFNDTGTIAIGKDYAYLDTEAFTVGMINSSANITLSNTTYDKSYPALLRKIMKDGVECGGAGVENASCVNITSFANNQFNFTVSSWSNYSIQKHVRDNDTVPISTGWNMISMKMEHNKKAGANKTIQLKKGWNLIGHSSDVNASLDNATFTNTTGSNDSFNDAAKKGKIQKYVAYMDRDTVNGGSSGNNKKYKFVGLSTAEDKLKKHRGYWVYANESGNLTLPNVGGSLDDENYSWTDLMFRNESSGEEKNITNAFNQGWIDDPDTHNINKIIYYSEMSGGLQVWKNVNNAPGSERNTKPWKGYFIYSNKENITLLRQN